MMCETASLAKEKEEKRETKTCQENEDKGKQEDAQEEEARKKATTTLVVVPFRDCSQDAIYKTIPQTKSHHRGGGVGVGVIMGHFPTILHILLSRAESCNYHDIVSWRPHGRCFVVYDRSLFVQHIMPMFFRQSQFPRQMNLYGFRRILKKNADYGAYYHESFLRTRPDLCERMQRPSANKSKDYTKDKTDESSKQRRSTTKSLMEEPNFSKMTPMPPTTKAEAASGADTSFALPNLTDAAAAVRMPMSAYPGPYNVPSVLGYREAAGGGGGGTSRNHSSRGNLMEARGNTTAFASANAVVDLAAAASFTIPSSSSWHGNGMGDMSNMAFLLQQQPQQQHHGSAFTPTVIAPIMSQPPTAAMVPMMAGGGCDRGGAILESLISAGLMANNHEQTNSNAINNINNLPDMMAWLEPTPIDPSVFQARSKKPRYVSTSSSMGNLTNMGNITIALENNNSNHMFKTSSSDSQLLAMQQQHQQQGDGETAASSLQRKCEMFLQHPQRLQAVADDQDALGMARFLSDVDLESDDHQHHRALAPNHVSSCLKRQASSTNPLAPVASPATATDQLPQRRQLHMHQEQPQNLLRHEQQQELVANDIKYNMNDSTLQKEQCDSATSAMDQTCMSRLLFNS